MKVRQNLLKTERFGIMATIFPKIFPKDFFSLFSQCFTIQDTLFKNEVLFLHFQIFNSKNMHSRVRVKHKALRMDLASG